MQSLKLLGLRQYVLTPQNSQEQIPTRPGIEIFQRWAAWPLQERFHGKMNRSPSGETNRSEIDDICLLMHSGHLQCPREAELRRNEQEQNETIRDFIPQDVEFLQIRS